MDRLEVERLLSPPSLLIPDIRPGSDRRVVLRQVRRGETVPCGVLPEILAIVGDANAWITATV